MRLCASLASYEMEMSSHFVYMKCQKFNIKYIASGVAFWTEIQQIIVPFEFFRKFQQKYNEMNR